MPHKPLSLKKPVKTGKAGASNSADLVRTPAGGKKDVLKVGAMGKVIKMGPQ